MSQRPRKLRRISKACDFCNRRSIKCSEKDSPLSRCQNCADFDVPCTYDRPTKRRGVKSGNRIAGQDVLVEKAPFDPGGFPAAVSAAAGRTSESPASRSSYCANASPRPSASDVPWSIFKTGWSANECDDDDIGISHSWKAFAIASDRQVRDLVQVYFEIVYPIFPLFHRPSFIEKVNNHEHFRSKGLFASTMAVCALVSSRARDGALYSNRWHREELIEPPSEAFFAAATNSIPHELVAATGANYMRACAVLAIASIQNGQIKNMQKFAGIYHTMSSLEGLHDERLWPKDLNPIEIEERRRLFWSIYTLDIYSTIVWGGVLRYREAHSLVRYPSELDDEFITDHGYGVPPTSPGSSSVDPGNVTVTSCQPVMWLRGWNFTTDLYRVLEHVVDGNRRRFSSANGTTPVWPLFGPASMSEPAVMEQVLAMYSALPSQFRETPPVTGDICKDLFGFQSANIQATLQLLRMLLLSAEEIGVDRKCDVAGELLSVFSKVPAEYLKAISSPLLHHLGGIGSILGSVMEGNLSKVPYQRVRTLVLEMADLLQRLETGLHSTVSASERLRSHVDRIDGFMRTSPLLNLPAAPPPPDNDVSVGAETEPGVPAAYASNGADSAIETNPALGDQMSLFQLPPELLTDWPWPLDTSCSEWFLPLASE